VEYVLIFVPEFPSYALATLFIAATLLAVAVHE
jgi:hypothetical protein